MPSRRTLASCIAAGILFASAAGFGASRPKPPRAPAVELQPDDAAYLDGRLVRWRPVSGGPRQKLLHAGPWLIGARINDKPRDGRLNLYVVAPGTQWHSEKAPQFDHNLIVNALPKEEGAVAEWDVYLAIVLDPTLHADIHTERDLILARQQSFSPPEDFRFSDIPGVAFLQAFLRFESLGDLEGFRRSDGTLPRLVLVPARAMVRATAAEIVPDTNQADSEGDSQPVPPSSGIKPELLPNGSAKPDPAPDGRKDPK